MRKIMLATAMLVPFAFAPPLGAQDVDLNARLTDSANVPKKGVVTYQGTYEITTGVGTGVTGNVQIVADFSTDNVSADLTIPLLSPNFAPSPPQHYTPTGVISGHGKHTGYTLTQGVFGSPTEPFISLSGSFFGPRALNTMGTFLATFCVPEPDCNPNGINVIRNVNATFSATRGSSPPS
jgi:hypothetical protein